MGFEDAQDFSQPGSFGFDKVQYNIYLLKIHYVPDSMVDTEIGG